MDTTVVTLTVEQWLPLTTHDRVGRDEMLGTVSETASALRSAHSSPNRPGAHMTILDRAGLEQIVCGCCRIVAEEFDSMRNECPIQ